MNLATFYPLLTLVSIGLFAWLGRRLALARNRNGLLWAIGAALLPPVLVILLLLPAAAPHIDEDQESEI